MASDFQYLMDEATRHTRAGNLQAATAAIQRALMPAPVAPPKARSTGDVIDVQARVVADKPPATPPRMMAQASAATATASTGPALSDTDATPTQATFTSHRLAGAGGPLDYKLFVPARRTSAPMPLVVMLHGCTQNPDDFAAGTGMNGLAQEQGFIVLYPAQSQQANPQRCWNWFKHNHQARDRGEPALIAGATRDVMANHPIDPQRVYVAGLSAGGAMAAIMGNAYPDLYAAVGVHSGLAAGAASDLPTALMAMNGMGGGAAALATCSVPTIVFHGDADSTVHPSNGERAFAACGARGQASNVEQIQAAQAGGHTATRTVRRAADGKVLAEYWVVHGARHAWSGGSTAGSYTDAMGPDASREMLRFFGETHGRAVPTQR